MSPELALRPAATFLGGLPHHEFNAAAELVLDRLPHLPAAPRLPWRSPNEKRVVRAIAGIDGVTMDSGGAVRVDVRRLDPVAAARTALPGESYRSLLDFLPVAAAEAPGVTVTLTGPLTLGLALIDAGAPADRAFVVAAAVTRARAEAVSDLVASTAPVAVLLVLDEPGLARWDPRDFPMTQVEVMDLLSAALASVPRPLRTGLACAAADEWVLPFGAGPDVVLVPVGGGVEAHPSLVVLFLDAGGWIGWGAVPVDRPIGADAGYLWKRLGRVWCDLSAAGCDPERLRTQALVTPTGDLTHHDPYQAGVVLSLVADLAERVEDQAVAARIAVGA